MLEVLRQCPGGQWASVYRSEVRSGPDPQWQPICLDLSLLDNGVPGLPLVLRVMSLQPDGQMVLLGAVTTSAEMLAASVGEGSGAGLALSTVLSYPVPLILASCLTLPY